MLDAGIELRVPKTINTKGRDSREQPRLNQSLGAETCLKLSVTLGYLSKLVE